MATTSDNRETVNDNIPTATDNIHLTVKIWKHKLQNDPDLKRPCRKIDQKSDWSNSEDGKDDQARSKPIDIPSTQDTYPRPSTSMH